MCYKRVNCFYLTKVFSFCMFTITMCIPGFSQGWVGVVETFFLSQVKISLKNY